MAIPKKGLQDIRSISSKSDEASTSPHKAYMRLSCLEMEKLRRGKEKESATHRVQIIDARFQEIEAEKAKLLKHLRQLNECISSNDSAIKTNPTHPHNSWGFKIRY